MKHMIPEMFTWRWKQMAIVTDGTAGSAASLFTTKMIVSGWATAFTYGGFVGERMDTSAYAGGNVENYQVWWPKVLFAAELGLWMTPKKAEWKVLAQGTNNSIIPGLDPVPLPFPTRAIVSFNWNMMYMKELGNEALPREWYSIPAHRHFDWWAKGLNNPKTSPHPKKLFDLYAMVATQDWCGLRTTPEIPGGGASSCPAAQSNALGKCRVINASGGDTSSVGAFAAPAAVPALLSAPPSCLTAEAADFAAAETNLGAAAARAVGGATSAATVPSMAMKGLGGFAWGWVMAAAFLLAIAFAFSQRASLLGQGQEQLRSRGAMLETGELGSTSPAVVATELLVPVSPSTATVNVQAMQPNRYMQSVRYMLPVRYIRPGHDVSTPEPLYRRTPVA